MKIRKSILDVAEKLEERLAKQEKYCKENDYDAPYLEINVVLTHRTKKNI
jgi:hypothetical protein